MVTSKKKIFTLCLSTTVVTTAYANSSDSIHGHIGGLTNQINRDIGDVPGNRYNGDFNFTYFNYKTGDLEQKFNFSALVNDQNLTMFSLQEAYVAKDGLFRPWDSSEKIGDRMSFGRKILPWSSVDALWGLGKFNNRKNFDFFDPGQEGLVGIEYENRSRNGFFWKAFGSPLYVPEMNPSLDINKSKKTITSRNPWANPPAASTQISDGGPFVPVNYIVEYPELAEVVFRYSVGATVGWENKFWVVDAFVMRKPENQISTKVNVKLNTPPEGTFVNAYIDPEFYYHDLYGGNLKYRNADLEMYVSGIAVRPNTYPDGNQEATDYTDIKTKKVREDYVGGGISKINDVYGMGFNYVARLSPFDRDRDSLAQDPRWNQALNGFLMRNFTQQFRLSADLKYDMLTTDRLVMLRANYNVSKEFLTTLGVNLIGTPDSGKSFWSPYTNNDSLFAGLRYIY
jgi:hypothetical protein